MGYKAILQTPQKLASDWRFFRNQWALAETKTNKAWSIVKYIGVSTVGWFAFYPDKILDEDDGCGVSPWWKFPADWFANKACKIHDGDYVELKLKR